MRIAAIVQARMSSRRLPGKVLTEVAGKPLLHYLHERLIHCRDIDGIIVSTSTDPSDDPVALFCMRHDIPFFRGSLNHVAQRFQETVEAFGLDAFVRVNGDSPLLDPHLIDHAVTLFRAGEADLVTNVFPRTFPPGQSVEVVRGSVFREICPRLDDPQDQEHVTRFFYLHPDDFKIVNFRAAEAYAPMHLAVDTPSDLERFRSMVQHMTKPHHLYTLDELSDLYAAVEDAAQGAAK
jgi:spore coat polysaccharide biosynthesis protein SpsF (cytidylyltransferase family)